MAQDTALQVIELQQLPIIVERLHSVKADIERRTAEATSLICTEETYKSVKDARAQLTKEFKEYEAQRTAIKSKILEPYNAFEQVYRECVTAPFQQADAELKQKIADVTSGIVAQKTEALMDYYGELVEAADIDWLDNLTYRPKVNMSDSLTSLKKQAKAFVDGIVADVAAIEGMDNAAEIMVEYRSNLDLPTAIKTVADRHKALEEQRRQNNVTIDSETSYLWPLPGYYRLTSLFGYRIHPITGKAHSQTQCCDTHAATSTIDNNELPTKCRRRQTRLLCSPR